jgi:hypothetical protein
MNKRHVVLFLVMLNALIVARVLTQVTHFLGT